jgi:hypothetical protein
MLMLEGSTGRGVVCLIEAPPEGGFVDGPPVPRLDGSRFFGSKSLGFWKSAAGSGAVSERCEGRGTSSSSLEAGNDGTYPRVWHRE